MSAKYTLVTAILFTMAALAWGFTLYATVQSGESAKMNMIVCAIFSVLAVGYWAAYFRGKNIKEAGTE